MPFPSLQSIPVLVTGGAGFIGSHLTRRLVDLGAHVLVLHHLSHGSRHNLAAHPSTPLAPPPPPANHPRLYNDVNINGTLNLLEAARQAGVKRVVYSASSSAY